MKRKNNLGKYTLIFEIIIITATTVVFSYLIDDWRILLFGGLVIVCIVLFSLFERRRYERSLERVSVYIDEILSGELMEDSEPVSDDMNSKLSHQLAKLQRMVLGYNENARKDKQEIRDLIVEIAHQLRMPIANIDTYLDLLSAPDLSEIERKQYLEAIDISKNKLIFLIESFIKMSRLESNIIQIRKETSDLNGTVHESVSQVKEKSKDKDLTLNIANAGDLSVAHDRNWLGEAIFNLLDNSVKYAPEGSAIDVGILKNDMFTEIRIIDEGKHIPIDEEHMIFKRFYRGTNVADQEGFGLGLFLTREIAHKHEGFVKYKKLDKGNSFSIFLPE